MGAECLPVEEEEEVVQKPMKIHTKYTNKHSSPQWIKLDTCSPIFADGGILIAFGEEKLILLADNHAIHIYDIIDKEWTEFMDFSCGGIQFKTSTCFDQDFNYLYIFYSRGMGSNHDLFCIDMESPQNSNRINVKTMIPEGYLINTPNDIHIIGGHNSNTHYALNKHTQTTHHIHTFNEYEYMHGICLLYIPSLYIILLIGGYNGSNGDTICQRLDLETNKWKKIDNIKFPYYGGEALLTKDERHVILSTKYHDGSGRHDEIFILDVIDKDTFELRQSKISAPTIKGFESCPERILCLSDSVTISDGNKILVHGFVRDIEWEISEDIVGIICVYCEDESLHCVRSGGEDSKCGDEHFVISVFDVLQ